MASFIYLNGYPGVRKLTVAKELSKLISSSKVSQNHLLIDPVAAIFDRDMEEYQPLRKLLCRECLNAISTSTSTKDATWIFTDASSSTGDFAAPDYQEGLDFLFHYTTM
jgi:tRNA uridine 5-carbamoylmethylation protein Kti12